MIEEDYCPFKIAHELKQKGFPQEVETGEDVYIDYGTTEYFGTSTGKLEYLCDKYNKPGDIRAYYEWLYDYTRRPTLYLVQKWLRETKDINLVIEPASYNCVEEKTSEYKCSAWFGDNYFEILPKFKTYEEALSEGINRALEQI